MPDGTINTVVGASVKRFEDQRFLTERGCLSWCNRIAAGS